MQNVPDNQCPHISRDSRRISTPIPITSLTLDVEEESVALAVRHHVGGDAGVEAGLVGGDALEDEGLVTQDDSIGHILIYSLSL